MYKKTVETIEAYNLIKKGDRIGVAVSGGMDSMALLSVLTTLSKEMEFELVCLHFEHGIRGESSREDAAFVQRTAEQLQVPFFMGNADVPEIAKEHCVGIEQAAREARYAFFETASKKLKLNSVATAHHKGDQAETLLLNLIRGSGLNGLTGMRFKREPNIIRPFLCVSRREIEAFVAEHGIDYREDATNQCTDYSRNYVRHIVMPAIEKLNPRAEDAFMRTAELLREDSEALQNFTEHFFKKSVELQKGIAVIDCRMLRDMPVKARVIRRAIEEIASLKDIEKVHVKSILNIAFGKTGREITVKNGVKAAKEYEKLVLYLEKNKPFPEVPLKIEGITLFEGGRFVTEFCGKRELCGAEAFTQYFNAEALSGAVLRTRRDGDRIVPFGQHSAKKLKDIFIDKKIPKRLRDAVPLIANTEEVLWAAGVAVSEKLRVTETTQNIIKICYLKDE